MTSCKSVELHNMELKNYKKLNNFSARFGKKTIICGKNALGKSTIMNAYLEVLTDKNSDFTVADDILKHDADGKTIDKLPAERTLRLKIDGVDKKVNVVTAQKWRKPRGCTEEVFDGNETKYEVDDFPYKKGDYSAFIEREIAPEDIVLLCSNPNAFLNANAKSTADGRKIIERVSGFSIEEVPGYKEIAEWLKGHSVEDFLKKERKSLTTAKKNLASKNVEIVYETGREIEELDVVALDKEIEANSKRISEIETEIGAIESGNVKYNALTEESMKLQFEVNEKIRAANADIDNKRRASRSELSKAKGELERAESRITLLESKTESESRVLASFEKRMEELKAEWNEEKNKKFDSKSTKCPYCGAEYSTDKIADMKKHFEEAKKSKVDEVIASGNDVKRKITVTKQRIAEFEEETKSIKKSLKKLNSDIEKAQKAYDAIPLTVDEAGVEGVAELKSRIAEIDEKLSKLNNGASEKKTLNMERAELMSASAKINGKISAYKEALKHKIVALETLEAERDSMAQIVAYIEMRIDRVLEFSRNKNEILASKVNKHFDHFQFKFVDWTIEGNPIETCKIVCNGTEYRSLNLSDRMLCQADLVKGFQDMNNLKLPIWIDNTESIDDDRIPTFDRQLIILKRTDDDELKVRLR